MEHLVGSIEVGKRADLVVLSKNLFDVANHNLAKVKIAMTMMGGRFTHGAPG